MRLPRPLVGMVAAFFVVSGTLCYGAIKAAIWYSERKR